MTYSPTWISESTQIGWTAPGNVDDSMLVPCGTVATFRDAVLGGGEFIYLLGAANTILGSVVTYLQSAGVSLTGSNADRRILMAPSAHGATALALLRQQPKHHNAIEIWEGPHRLYPARRRRHGRSRIFISNQSRAD